MSVDFPITWLLGVLLAATRVGGLLLIAPPFSHGGIPRKIRVLLSIGLAFAVAPPAPVDLLTGPGVAPTARILLAGATEFLIGSGLGFITMTIFAALQVAGAAIDMLAGFALSQVYDPLLQVGTSVMGRLYHLTALTLMFFTNAHLIVLEGLLRTYDELPVGAVLDTARLARGATETFAGMFLAAMQIAAPILAVLFLTDVGLGLLTRVAPALNAFALGFPLKILVTLVMVGLSYLTVGEIVRALTNETATVFGQIVTP